MPNQPPAKPKPAAPSKGGAPSRPKYTPEQEKRYQETQELLARARTVSPSDMVQRLFPELEIRQEGRSRDQWMVRLGAEDRLIITGDAFNLNWVRGGTGRFYGAGSINLWCDLKNQERRQHYMDAAKAIDVAFFNGIQVDAKSLREQLEAKRKKAQLDKAKQEAPASLPPASSAKEDVSAVSEYLVSRRGLSREIVGAAIEDGAIYATRQHPNFDRPDSKPEVGVVFRLIQHEDDSVPAFAWRSLVSDGPYSKINRGPKTLAAFRVGSFDRQRGTLAVTESAIEALSYWDYYSQNAPSAIENLTVVGMSGQGSPEALLQAAKNRGFTKVRGAYNNDIAGRGMNDTLLQAAKELGLEATADLFYGEVEWTWLQHKGHAAHDQFLFEQLAKKNIPHVETDCKKGWKTVRMPNIEDVRSIIPELNKLRMGKLSIFAKNEAAPLVADLLKDLASSKAECSSKEYPSGTNYNVFKTPEVDRIIGDYRRREDVEKASEGRAISFKSGHLADATWICKDWNDRLQQRDQFLFEDHPKVIGEYPKSRSKIVERER